MEFFQHQLLKRRESVKIAGLDDSTANENYSDLSRHI